MTEYPLVFVAVLAKQKAKLLPEWLKSLSEWDYPKDRIILYIRSNNNTDTTEIVLREWVEANRKWYRLVVEDYRDIEVPVQDFGVHEWNAIRFKALGAIREHSVELAWQSEAQFYWVIDVDNFVLPHTLRTLVALNLPVVAPLLRYALADGEEQHKPYSNYHLLTNVNGYYLDDIRYYTVLNREIKGLIQCDVVHCTYLIRRDVFENVRYVDDTDDYEYVIFSRELRKQAIPQYLDNREIYGHLTLHENVDACVHWMKVLSESKA
jgi:Glycosyl transferase family 2